MPKQNVAKLWLALVLPLFCACARMASPTFAAPAVLPTETQTAANPKPTATSSPQSKIQNPKSKIDAPLTSPAQVVVVANRNSPDSLAIADYYVQKRRVPRANLVTIACPTTEDCEQGDFDKQIGEPVTAFLQGKDNIVCVVLTKGIPFRVRQDGSSVDGLLALPPEARQGRHLLNPYFGKTVRFSRAKFGYLLVTRLEGYTRADCLALVDRSLAAKPLSGPFLLHAGPGHEEPSYTGVNEGVRKGMGQLLQKGMKVIPDTGEKFPGEYLNLMGYFSWGSNDWKWNRKVYNSLRFAPGGIAETVVSTSGRTFANPTAPGQSLIADLIAQGVTGCKGYVAEPYADAIARADVLFDRYTSGFTLAESFYCASRYLGWKDVVIGDPLCAPYASTSKSRRP